MRKLVIIIMALLGTVVAAQNLPITEDTTYTVVPGDSLEIIAARFDVSVDCLIETNELTSSSIQAGIELLISVECPYYIGMQEVEFPREDAPGRVAEAGTYVVQPRQTLDEIAQELDISLQSLRIANDIQNVRDVVPGLVLTIPEDAPAYGVFPALDMPTDETAGAGGGLAGEIYVVQRGDTLDTIAQEFDVSLVSLRTVNELTAGQTLLIGQSILIPEDAPAYGVFPALDTPTDETAGAGGGLAGEIYVVQPGDTLDTIAQEFDVSVIQLAQVNGLEDDVTITPGQSILIPEDAVAYGEVPPLDEPDLAASGGLVGEIYVVQRGDTLDTIAQEYNVSVVSLKTVNDIANGNSLRIGQSILIPEDAPAYGEFPATITDETLGAGGGVDGDLYVVQVQDTIDQIGADYNAARSCIIEANPQIENVRAIKPGDTILVPTDCPPYNGTAIPRTTTTTPEDTAPVEDTEVTPTEEDEEAAPAAG